MKTFLFSNNHLNVKLKVQFTEFPLAGMQALKMEIKCAYIRRTHRATFQIRKLGLLLTENLDFTEH